MAIPGANVLLAAIYKQLQGSNIMNIIKSTKNRVYENVKSRRFIIRLGS